MGNAKKTVLVTGDVIVDHHVYMGERGTHDSQRKLGTREERVLGGAGLLFGLLDRLSRAEADEMRLQRESRLELLGETLDQLKGAAIDATDGRQVADAGNRERIAKQLQSIRDQINSVSLDLADATLTERAYDVHFGLDVTADSDLPPHLHGYAIWKPVPESPGSKNFVWRIEKPLGYGSIGDASPTFSDAVKRRGLERVPSIIVIDDAGLGIRFGTASGAWPEALEHPDEIEWVVLKMARPLAHGALWDALQPLRHKLVTVVSIDDVRRAAVRVTRGISWERTALDLADELWSNDEIKTLLECRHLVIDMRSEGALHAETTSPGETVFRLIFDPEHIEGDWAARHDGSVFGFTSCLTAGIVHRLVQEQGASQLDLGIKSGLAAMRRLFLKGHGPVNAEKPGYPFDRLAREILDPTVTYQRADLPTPSRSASLRDAAWTVIASAEARLRGAKLPLYGIAKGVALVGSKTLSHVPHGRFGKLRTVDRSEIEAFRSIHELITEYLQSDEHERPLSLAVFGPPGSGKSFAVKQMARAIVGPEAKILEFNLSQFADSADLIGAFHQIRDRVLGGSTPFVFWDEFDCSEYKWLQYLLAPMQDGAFQEGQITHPIGKCVFVFAGGTSHTMETFGPQEAGEHLTQEVKQEAFQRKRQFELLKGPDFKSRIAGFLNVLGPNRRRYLDRDGKPIDDETDIYFPIRRALFVRTVLGVAEDERLDIDRGVLAALLEVPRYTHGSRSLEKLVLQIRERSRGALRRSGLPSPELLSLFVDDWPRFLEIMERNRTQPIDVEKLAKEIHQYWWERSRDPVSGWPISHELNQPYDRLEPKWKMENRAAAMRIPEVLELAGLYVDKDENGTGSDKIVDRVIDHYVELLAEAEHDGWFEFRRRNGWILGDRDDEKKRHPDLRAYRDLTDQVKNKDRESVRQYPIMLGRAGYRIVHSPT